MADLNGQVIGSASSLIVQLEPEYADHTWEEITGNGMMTTHNPQAIAFMEQIFPHTQSIGTNTLEKDCMTTGKKP